MDFTEFSLSKATIQLDKLLNNITQIKKILKGPTQFMAVIKADAYSHGAVPIAQAIEAEQTADYFGVAQLSEALELRDEHIKTPILVFNTTRSEDIKFAIKNNITLTVISVAFAEDIVMVAAELKQEVKVHLKIDSGMGRIGVCTFAEAEVIYQALQSDYVNIEGIFTHFAEAQDDSADNFTQEQFKHFNEIINDFEKNGIKFDLNHCCNTAGTINFPEYHLDMVRVGLGLYGYDPTGSHGEKISLTPVKNIEARVTYLKDFPVGQSVGYDRTYFSEKPLKIATVAMGYADGVAKSLSNKGWFTYKGAKLPIIGAVCMDQIMLDCTEVPELVVGDDISYFGDTTEGHTSLIELTEVTNESPYDLLCRMGQRVQRIYE